MNISAISLKQKFGTLYFYFTLDSTEYVFVISQSKLLQKGILKNKKTKQESFITYDDENLNKLLQIVDFWIEHQKKTIIIEEDNVFKNARKELTKDINQTKKYYYNIIKSNFQFAYNHRRKEN